MKVKCRHPPCQREASTILNSSGKTLRCRGLCWACSLTPEVRSLYPSANKFAQRGREDFCGQAPLPKPTTARPGSAEKKRVLADRCKRGESLFHPLDQTWETREAVLVSASSGDEDED